MKPHEWGIHIVIWKKNGLRMDSSARLVFVMLGLAVSAVGAAAATTTVEASSATTAMKASAAVAAHAAAVEAVAAGVAVKTASVAASVAAAEALAGLGVHGVATTLSNLSGCAAAVSVAVVCRSIVGRTNGAIAEASIVGAVYRALIASEV